MLPLEGIKVIDLSRYLPGPSCTWFLADMGAEVIKLEEFGEVTGRRAEQGAGVTRRRLEEAEAEFRMLHGMYQRNKKSVGLNLRTEEGRQVLYKLVEKADVVVEAFRPGTMKRLGADYETLAKINPRIVYCSVTVFGQDGPYSQRPGFDPVACGVAGAIGVNGDDQGRPVAFGVPIADVGSGLHAAYGIMCALWARQTTGRGQLVDVAMSDIMMSFMGLHAGRYFGTSKITKRGFPSLTVMPPLETKDGKYIISVNETPNLWANWCRALGRPDFLPVWHEPDEKRRGQILNEVRKIVKTKTRDEWFRIAKEMDISLAPVLEVDEAFADPHVLARQMVVEIGHPKHGKIRQLGIPIKLSETPGKVRTLPVPLGHDTDAVLASFGFSKGQLHHLRDTGVIK